jgi:hypothetical protein
MDIGKYIKKDEKILWQGNPATYKLFGLCHEMFTIGVKDYFVKNREKFDELNTMLIKYKKAGLSRACVTYVLPKLQAQRLMQ